ncbi:MAG: glycosyltransferase [Phycisphaeraceae bacterium JB051]
MAMMRPGQRSTVLKLKVHTMTNANPKVTAIVICHNAAEHLDHCLRTLRWADELFVVNVHSTDNTLEIASCWADRIISWPDDKPRHVVRQCALEMAHHPWVLIAQPQDRLDENFARDLRALLSFEQSLAQLHIPRDFYFKNERMTKMPWGMHDMQNMLLFNTERCDVQAKPHPFIQVNDGFESQDWPAHLGRPVRSQWFNAVGQLAKHWFKLLPVEARNRHFNGQPFKFSDLSTKPLRGMLKVAKHAAHPGEAAWAFADTAFDFASSMLVLMHQLRRTPKLDLNKQSNQETAERQAA